jgi:hypothetical protein
MFAAEQYAQAQAAAQAVAAAQYYANFGAQSLNANMTAAAAVSAAGQHHPQPPPGSMASAPQDFGPFVTQAGGPPPHRRGPPGPPGSTGPSPLAVFAPAPPILSGLQGSNQINPYLLQQQPPLPPREPSSSRFVKLHFFKQFYKFKVYIEDH